MHTVNSAACDAFVVSIRLDQHVVGASDSATLFNPVLVRLVPHLLSPLPDNKSNCFSSGMLGVGLGLKAKIFGLGLEAHGLDLQCFIRGYITCKIKHFYNILRLQHA